MITLFILALVGTALMFAAVPVVAFALMLETCAERADAARSDAPRAQPRRSRRDLVRLASAA